MYMHPDNLFAMYRTNVQSKQQLVLHADTKFNYKVNNLIENMKYVLYDANIEFNAEKRAHVKCTPNKSRGTQKTCENPFGVNIWKETKKQAPNERPCHTNDVDDGQPMQTVKQ